SGCRARRGGSRRRAHQPGRQVVRQRGTIVMQQQPKARQPIEEALEMGWPSHGKKSGSKKKEEAKQNGEGHGPLFFLVGHTAKKDCGGTSHVLTIISNPFPKQTSSIND